MEKENKILKSDNRKNFKKRFNKKFFRLFLKKKRKFLKKKYKARLVFFFECYKFYFKQ
jgi:hypothetical protein